MKTTSDIALSYNTDKWQLGLNYSHDIGHYSMSYGNEKIQNGNRSISETADKDKRNSYSSELSFVWTPKASHKLSFNSSINLIEGPGITNTVTNIYEGMNTLKNILKAQNHYLRQHNIRYNNSLSYQYQINDKNSFSIISDWTHFDGDTEMEQPNSYFSAAGVLQKSYMFYSKPNKDIDIYAILADWQYKPNKDTELLAGAKTSFIKSDNDFLFYNKDVMDRNRSNKFKYDENNLEGYVQYTLNKEKWTFSTGLRMEYMNTKGLMSPYNSLGKEENKTYHFRLFPNFSMSYKLNEHSNLSFQYSRRQDKAKYEDLNPFEYLLDELTYWKGNPFLKPQISNKITLSYVYRKLSLSLFYNQLNDYFSSITDALDKDKTIMTTKNIGLQRQIATEAIYSARLVSWWDITANAGVYYFMNTLDYENYKKKYKRPSCVLSVSNNFYLPLALNLEVAGRYFSKRQGGSYEVNKSTGSIDIGLNRTWLNRRLRVSVIMTDILHTERWDNYGTKDALSISSWGCGESRKIMIRIGYNWGKQKFSSSKKDIEELNRL